MNYLLTEVIENQVKGWEKFANWCGNNFNAVLVIGLGAVIVFSTVFFITKLLKSKRNTRRY